MAAPLTRVERALVESSRDLQAEGVAHARVGGRAVSARAEPRTTRDVELAVDVGDDAAAEQLVFRLRGRGYVVRSTVEHRSTRRLSTARLVRAIDPGVYVDLLFASSGIEHEVIAAADRVEIVPSVTVPVATRAHLIALKLLARDDRHRPQDWDDLQSLLADATADDLETARSALAQIASRGYARGRDLPQQLDELLAEVAAGGGTPDARS